ncbi:MAG: ComEC/Rec2 family competence protein, partial [Clostridia bacterium]
MRRFLPAPPERNSVLMTLGAAFFVGCRLAAYLSDGAWQWVLCALGVALIPLLRRAGMRSTAALFLIALSLGILRTQACLYPVQPLAGKYELTGYVYGEPRPRADGRLNFTLTRVTLNGEAQPGRAYCTAYEHGQALPTLFDGAALRFVGRVYLPEGKSGMHRFDFRQWMLQNGMSYGVVISKGIEVCGTPETAPWMDVASRMRAIFRNALRRVMGEEARVATALLLSDREGIAEEETKAFQTLGIAHVMAVSGLHVGLLGGALLALLDALSVRRKRQLPIVALFLAGYCALTGFSAASMRAAVMMLSVLGARLLTRAPDALTSLATAALVVLLVTPLQAYSAGFVLSFSAVLGIVLLNPVFLGLCNRRLPRWRGNIYARRSPARRMLDWLSRHFGTPRQLLCLSLSAQLGVLLPTAIYFHQLPLYGVLVNLLVIPYMGVLVPACALALLCSPIPLLGMGVGAVAAALVRLLLWAVELLSALPGASVRVAAAPMMIVAGGAAVALICSRRMRGGMGRKALAALLVGVLAVAGTYVARPAELRYVQLSVGRGDASLLLDGDQTIVVDVGSDGLAVLDYLLAEGRDIDALYLTHLHLDHVGGVRALLDGGIRIRQAYL